MAMSIAGLAAGATTVSVAALGRIILAVPAEGRPARRAMPRVIHLIWPLVRVIAHYVGPRLGAAYRDRVLRRLRKAELDEWLLPPQWVACRVIAAAAATALGLVLVRAGFPAPAMTLGIAAMFGAVLPERWLGDRIAGRERSILRGLPACLDRLTLAVEAGCGLVAALALCTEKMEESPLRRALARALGEIRAGRPRLEALEAAAVRVDLPAMTAFVGALRHAERTGASVGALLRAQSSQRLAERFARAEKLAMEAPVKMLGPLIACIFPCTFIVLGFPIVIRLMEGL